MEIRFWKSKDSGCEDTGRIYVCWFPGNGLENTRCHPILCMGRREGKVSHDIASDFVSRVKEMANPDEKILVMCRSGGRSAIAVNMLANAGYKNVFQIVDGMEGDSVEDPSSVFNGQRMKNGWKNSGCPWTYHLTTERLLLPKDK